MEEAVSTSSIAAWMAYLRQYARHLMASGNVGRRFGEEVRRHVSRQSEPGEVFAHTAGNFWVADLPYIFIHCRFTIRIGPTNVVYLNTSRAVTDLLEKRAPIYASRPSRPMTQDIASGGVRMLFMGHTDRWRNQRKIMHNILNSSQAETKFVKYQELESKQLVYGYLKDPEHWYRVNQHFSNSIIMSLVFGRRAGLDDAILTKMLTQMMEIGRLAFAPSLWSAPDFFPWLAHLPKPLQWWRPYGEDLFKRTLQ